MGGGSSAPAAPIARVPGTGAGTAGYTPMANTGGQSGAGAIAGALSGAVQNYGAGGSGLGGAAFNAMNPSGGGAPLAPGANGSGQGNLTPLMGDANAGSDLNSATASSALAGMQGGGFVHPMAHPTHPMWGLLHHVSGMGKAGIPAPPGPTSGVHQPVQTEPSFDPASMQGQPPAMSKGGVITPVSKMPPTGPLPANFGSARNYSQGGPVQNYGSRTNRLPMFPGRAMGAIPAGRSMGQGITPASPEGQLGLAGGGPMSAMMGGLDNAGPVNESLGMPPSGTQWTQMQPAQSASSLGMTRGTGLVGGMGQGMDVMKNIQENWRQREQRNAVQDAETAQEKANMDKYHESQGLPTADQQASGQTGAVGMVHGYIDKFADLIHSKTLDDKANTAAPGLPPTNTGVAPGSNTVPPTAGVQAPPPWNPTPAAPAPPPPPAQGATAPGQPGKPGVSGAPGTPGTPAPAPGAPGGMPQVTVTGQRPPGAPAAAAPAIPPPPPPGSPPAVGADVAQTAQATGAPPQTAVAAGKAASQTTGGAAAAGATPEAAAASGTAVGDATATIKPTSAPAQIPGQGGTKESLDQHDWEDMEKAKWKAARAATAAGMDGNQVYQSLTNLQTAHLQGQYMKWGGVALQRLQNGDQDGVEQAVKAMSYYLPNGAPLQLHKATAEEATQYSQPGNPVTAGTFIVQNPFAGMPGHEGSPTKVPLTAISLSSMLQAAQDPVAFGTGLQGQYVAGAKASAELQRAHAAQTLASGRNMMGQAAVRNSLTNEALSPYRGAEMQGNADRNTAVANKLASDQATGGGGGTKVTIANLRAAQNDSSKQYMDSSQGEITQQPAMVPNPNDPNHKAVMPNPQANKPGVRDIANRDPVFAGQTQEDIQQGAALAGELHGANIESDSRTIVRAAAQIINYNKSVAKDPHNPPQHINPQTKKPDKDVVTDMVKGRKGVGDGQDHPAKFIWNPAKQSYDRFWLSANIDTRGPAIDPGGGAPSRGGGGGGGGGGSADDATSPEEAQVATGQDSE